MITNGRIWSLELLRGVAAIAVVWCHVYLLFPAISRSELERAFSNWGVTSVVVFFVLSGAVIRLSVERSGVAMLPFMWRRNIRIVPLYLLAVLVAAALDPGPFSVVQFAGHMAFTATLPGWVVPTYEANPVLWSLTYEMWFYLLFALIQAQGCRGDSLCVLAAFLAGAATLSAASLPVWGEHIRSILAFFGVWLIGYFAAKFRRHLAMAIRPAVFMAASILMWGKCNLSGGYPDYVQSLMIGVALAPLLASLVSIHERSPVVNRSWALPMILYLAALVGLCLFSDSRVHAKILYGIFPLVVVGAIGCLNGVHTSSWLPRFACWLGMISYALYLFHFPLLFSAQRWFGQACAMAAWGSVALSFGLAHWLETGYQPVVSRWLNQLIGCRTLSESTRP